MSPRIIGANTRALAAATMAPAVAAMPPAVASVTPPAVRHLQVDEGSAGQRLDNYLLRELKGVPKSHVYRVIRSGEVRVNKKRVEAQTKLRTGDLVRVPPMRVSRYVSGCPKRGEASSVSHVIG